MIGRLPIYGPVSSRARGETLTSFHNDRFVANLSNDWERVYPEPSTELLTDMVRKMVMMETPPSRKELLEVAFSEVYDNPQGNRYQVWADGVAAELTLERREGLSYVLGLHGAREPKGFRENLMAWITGRFPKLEVA